MPNRRKRSHGKREDRGITRSHVALLEEFISDHTGYPTYGKKWVQEWLLNVGSRTLIPPKAPVTLIGGLRILFEYPYGTILYRLGCLMRTRFDLLVAIGDKDETRVVVYRGDRIVRIFSHRAERFRFQNRTELEKWMSDTSSEIRTAFRRHP